MAGPPETMGMTGLIKTAPTIFSLGANVVSANLIGCDPEREAKVISVHTL